MTASNSTHEVYIIHLWRLLVNDSTWRGKIQNFHTGRSLSIAQLNELEEAHPPVFKRGTKKPAEAGWRLEVIHSQRRRWNNRHHRS